MPSTLTHAYIGIESLKKLHNKPKNIINKRINNYKIYCQNMDILYFYHIFLLKGNIIQKLGHRFHAEHVYDSFKMLIDDNRKNKDLELFTFISGLIVHYISDSIMHPYIDFLSHNDNKRIHIDKHFEIETYIDNYFVNKYEKINYMKDNNSSIIFNYTREKIIEEEINKLFKTYWHFDNMGKFYYKALKDMHYAFKYVRHDKYGIKRKIYQFIDLNPFNLRKFKYLSYHFNLDNDEYYLNLNHQEWFNYCDKKQISNKSFLDLMEDVINQSSNIINNIYEYIFEEKDINLKELIGNNSYSTGLSIDN